MNKHLQILATTCLCLSATTLSAEVTPCFFENFKQAAAEGVLPQGWITYGSGYIAADTYKDYFGDKGEAPYFRPFEYEGQCAAWSNSTFEYTQAADEWLVTPAIHIDSDTQILQLTAYAWGSFDNSRYRVLISETGQTKEDFRPSPLLNTTLRGTYTDIQKNKKTSYIAFNGYAGKDIYLAFVNKSTDTDLLGFTDISIQPYAMNITNYTPEVLPAGSTFNISFNTEARLPIDVEHFTVKLTASDGTTETRTVDQPCGINGARFALSFDEMTLKPEGLTYTIEITPDYEGAPATTLEGEVRVPLTSYPPVAVIEEFTGTWCTNCPRGAAFLNYYHDKYTGTDGTLKAVSIALHDKTDPMYITGSAYYTDAYTAAGISGLPSAYFNRKTKADPSDKKIVEDLAATRSNSKIEIKKVEYTEGQPLKVNFSITHSYEMKDMNRRVAFVIVENKVNKNASKYEQSNGFSGISQRAVENTYGEDLWPYFKFYCESPQLIPAKDMVYEHVARSIYPDYAGTPVTGPCAADEPVNYTISFAMPDNVLDPANTAVIAMLLNGTNGEVMGAAEVNADNYNKDITSIATPKADFATVVKNGNTLSIASHTQVTARLYAADGTLLSTRILSDGNGTMDCSAISGITLLHLTDADGSVMTHKFIF